MLTATQLADQLGVTRARVSQMVAAGKLDGSFTGSGKARRFDPEKAAACLGQNLHPGQMLGNGAKTKAAIKSMASPEVQAPAPARQKADAPITAADPDRYEMARILLAEENARTARRKNEEAEGNFVLASEVALQVARQIGQEVAEFETVIRDGARAVADHLGVDFKTTRKILLDAWRAHRAERAKGLAAQADAAPLTPSEQAEDI